MQITDGEVILDGEAILDRAVAAVEKVRERLLRATTALENAQIPYAVVGGNAVFLWMTQRGAGGERFTPNVDLLLSRVDLSQAKFMLEAVGFVGDPERQDLLRDGPNGSPRTRLRLLFAEEKVREADLFANPVAAASTCLEEFQVLCLPELVQTKLVAFRIVDRVHLLDMLDVGLIDQSWTVRYPPELAGRLQALIDDPDG